MGSFKIEKCGGELPAWDDRFLPDDQASKALNTYLYSGAALGWRVPKVLHQLQNSAAKFAFRIPVISQGVAGDVLTLVNNAQPGDTVTVGEITYTFRGVPANPFDVLLGATAAQSAEALFLAVHFGSFDTTIVGANTQANPGVAGGAAVLGEPYAFVAGTNTPGANTVVLTKVIPSSTMKLTAVNCVPQATQGAAKFKAVVYESVNQSNPTGTAFIDIATSLIGTGGEVVGCVAGATLTSTLPVPITLQGGSVYWVGFIMDTAIPLQLASAGLTSVSNSNPYTSGPPNPFQTLELSGVTTGGTTVGTLESAYNSGQPNWQVWASMAVITATDPQNSVTGAVISLQAPEFGQSFNQTPVAESTNGARMSWATSFFTGGANQVAATEITGASTWLEFLDQDTNVLRTPVVDDSFQRYYFASATLPPQYNTYDRIKNGQAPYYLGVPAPPIAPTLTTLGGGNPSQLGFPNATGSATFAVPGDGTSILVLYPVQSTLATTLDDVGLVLTTLGSSDIFTASAMLFANVAPTTANPNPANAPGDLIAQGSSYNIVGSTGFTFPLTVFSSFGTINTTSGFTEPGTGVNLAANVQYWLGVLMTSETGSARIAISDTGTKGFSAVIGTPGSSVAPAGSPVGGGAGGGAPLPATTPAIPFGIGGGLIQGQAGGSGDNGGSGVSLIDVSGILTTSTTSNSWLPKDPATGAPQAPPMTANFVDLQLWADLDTNSASGAQEETRAYAYTWVTAYGEEGPPSPPTLLDAYDNATWVVGMQPPLPEDMGTLRDIVSTNIYRTMSSVQGGTVFFLVGTVAASATTFVDAVTDDVVATNLILPSTTWFAPPTTLEGIVTLPNGMMAGFRGNEVWFCEPFRPHAWPSQYVMTTDYPIVGLGVTGTALIACTETTPNVFNGVNPSVMTQSRITLPEPCTSRGSVLSTENGVYYTSANGLIKVNGGGFASNMTQAWITREKWQKLTPQKNVRAVKNVSAYFALGSTGVTNGVVDKSVAQDGFTIELSEVADQQSFTLWPQVGGHRIGFCELDSPIGLDIDNVLCDVWSGVALLVAAGNVYYYDFTDQAPEITPYLWRSKKFQGHHKDNFSAFRVWYDIPPGGPQTPPTTRTTVPFTNHPPKTAQLKFVPGMLGVVRIIADGLYVTERELRESTELMRISSMQKYTTWQVEIEGVMSITNVKIATSVKELGTMK